MTTLIDPALDAAVRLAIVAQSNQSSGEESPSIRTLVANGMGIRTLLGIETLAHLRELEIAAEATADDLPPSTLVSGRKLVRNSISDIQPLARLPELCLLSLMGNPVATIEPLRHNSALRVLNIADCRGVQSIAPLAAHGSLIKLNLRGDRQLRDLSALGQLTELTVLDLCDTAPTDFSFLSHLRRLQRLVVKRTGLRDLEPMAPSSELAMLDVRENPISDLRPIERLPRLRALGLSGCAGILDLSPLRLLGELATLAMDQADLADVRPLGDLHSLRKLSLCGNKIRSIESLAAMAVLEELDLSGNPVEDWSPLLQLPRLRRVAAIGSSCNGSFRCVAEELRRRGAEVTVEALSPSRCQS